MKPQMVAALLLLLVCAMVSPYPVVGGKKRPRCTEEDKAHVLRECGHYTRHGHPKELPPQAQPLLQGGGGPRHAVHRGSAQQGREEGLRAGCHHSARRSLRLALFCCASSLLWDATLFNSLLCLLLLVLREVDKFQVT
ncbi:hypothetical protein C2845_PM17G04850 [Panicum miliaceum]|uniref:Uncharacterized protein n=1 Tax=Panicum miliaceum TaxID=4540 RepID=A0A3L6Q2U6_PANMI|nr:hypothetical protein C2845_PM17G04850 [Panicum miliaceum]